MPPPQPYTVGAAPLALRGLLQFGLQAHQVVGAGARVTQDDLAALLAHLTVVLMIRLVSIAILSYGGGKAMFLFQGMHAKYANFMFAICTYACMVAKARAYLHSSIIFSNLCVENI